MSSRDKTLRQIAPRRPSSASSANEASSKQVQAMWRHKSLASGRESILIPKDVRISRRIRTRSPCLVGASGTVIAINHTLPLLGTWGFLGYALYHQAWLLQPVRIFGIDLLIVLVNYAIAMAVVSLLDRSAVFAAPVPVSPRHAVRWCCGVLAALAAWCVLSVSSGGDDDQTVRVAALQPGVRPREVGSTPEARDRRMLDRLGAQTREATARGARLVVWPEGALAADPALAYRDELGHLARDTAATLVVGYGIRTPAGFRNEVITVDPGAGFIGRYGKDHPVGFLGETSVWRGTYPTVAAAFGREIAFRAAPDIGVVLREHHDFFARR